MATRASSASLGDEGYELTIDATGVRIVAHQPAGLFYGVQTLRQLLPWSIEYQAARPRPVSVPFATIVDRPRFVWRGAMLDVARHFFGVDDVKRYIDLIALYKLNRLHLHLSDDQGWRIEVKSWPKPDETRRERSSWRWSRWLLHAGANTRDIVRYAQDRFITIVPGDRHAGPHERRARLVSRS